MQSLLSSIAATLILASIASAQSFNIDVGNTTYPTPSPTFGAGAGQTGVWNAKNRDVAGITPLNDLAGAATTATFGMTAGSGGSFYTNNAGTTGDDEALMDDAQFPATSGGATWTIAGLEAGTYDVYTYAWAPDSATFESGVSVNGGPVTAVGGAWTGAYLVGETHALDTVIVSAGGSINITLTAVTSFATFNGVQVVKVGTPFTSFCLGDGTGLACPCGNNGSAGNGCANSAFAAGALLVASGTAGASLATDTLVLTATNVPGPGLFFQSNGIGTPATFGDGQLCASIGILRLGVVFPTSGSASYPGGLTPNPIHVGGLANNGDTKHYQCWYRDAITFCTAFTFNLSQGITLTWGP